MTSPQRRRLLVRFRPRSRGLSTQSLYRRRVDRPTRLVAIVLILASAAVQVWDPPLVEAARLRMFDQFQRWSPRPPPAQPRVVIVDVDDRSLDEVGQWPWPRSVFARMIDRLGALGASVVTFDVLFAEPDRLSPPLYAVELDALDAAAAAVLRRLPNNERLMADAMRRHPVVLGEGATNAPQRRTWSPSEPPSRIAWLGVDDRRRLPSVARRIPTLAPLAAAARGIGLVAVGPEVDGVVRRAPSATLVGRDIVPSLGLEALRVASAQDTLILDADAAGIRRVLLAGLEIPTDRDGRIWIHYAPIETQPVISSADVLAGRIAANAVRGKIAIVGASAAGLGDIKVTPIDGNMPGTAVHAQLIEAAVAGSVLRRPSLVVGAERLVVGLLGGALAWWGVLLPAGTLPVVLAVVLAGAGGISWLAFDHAGLLIDGGYPAVALAALLFWLAMAKYIREESRRRSVRRAFGHYLSPVMVDRVVASPAGLGLAGERRELTILFSDIRNFTTLTEELADDPERMTELLNRYFTAMTEIIHAEGGTIDKYIGDAIMAFWNAPLDDPAHARRAALAAIGMQRRLHTVNAELASDFTARGLAFQPLRIGIGLDCGLCYVGNLGSKQRFNYSTIGDPVNAAARIEDLTKAYGFGTLIGAAARAAAPGLACLEIDRVQLKGKSRPTAIFALLGGDELTAARDWPPLVQRHAELRSALLAVDHERAEEALAACTEHADRLGLADPWAAYAAQTRALIERIGARRQTAS